MAKGWLDNFGKDDNYNDYQTHAPEGFQGDGYSNVGRNSSPAWGGQFQLGGSVYPVNYVPEAQTGGSFPGATGFSYARTGDIPSEGPYAKKTMASAQNGKEMQYYQQGLDWKPKTISRDGSQLDKAQTGENVKFDPKKFAADKKRNTPLQRSIDKEAQSEDYRRWVDTKEYKDQVKANKIANDKAILADRKDRMNKSVAAQKKSFTKDNWRQQLADETQATGDKFRMFPEDPDSFIDEWMNPGVMIGNMASDLGSAPLRAQQEDSYMPYVTSIGVPLLTGGLEGIGAKTNKQFVSNLVNPLNIVPGYKSVEKSIGKKLGNISTSIAPELRQGLRTAGPSLRSDTGSKIDWGKDYFEKIQNKGKELENLISSDKITFKDYVATEQEYKKELAKSLGLEKSLGSGNYGEVFELPNDPSKVIKLGNPMSGGGTGATNWTPELIEKLKSVKQNANIAIPEQVEYFEIPSLYQGYGPKTKEVMTMPNLNQTAAENLNLNKRDRYALFLKQARQLRDQGIKLDVKNIENFKFNKDKGVFDIYDVNPGYISNPGYYMQDVVNKTKGPLLEHMQFKQGGIIKDDRGQWDHPGEITEIGSNDITMEGVPYDVLGISDTGDTKLMKPGKKYKFKGKKVTEYPMAQNGLRQEQKGLQNLDNLTNFTNYNTKQPGGWLDTL